MTQSPSAPPSRSAARPYWPAGFPRHLRAPATTLHANLEISARRYPAAPAIEFLGRTLSYREFHEAAVRFAGWLQRRAGVRRGDRVLLFLQNSPQWLIAYYGTLRSDAVVVPINPMNRSADLKHYLRDSGAKVAVCAQDIAHELLSAAENTLKAVVVATYSDLLPDVLQYPAPEWVAEARRAVSGTIAWEAVMAADERPAESVARPDDLALLPYTSGSTGVGKACMHPHSTFMHIAAGSVVWHAQSQSTVFLGVAPMYQVAGLLNSVNGPVFAGGTVVPVPRWDRQVVADLIERYRVNHVALAPTAVIDLLALPGIERRDLSSIRRLGAGGSAMPQAVWNRLQELLGLPFIEAYGMTETAATTHVNPFERPKAQCLGIPFFDTESRIVDPDTLQALGPGEVGEILVSGPQLFNGYWGLPAETAAALVELDGQRYYRSGDLGYVDEEGYFFMTDRLKRMINASGFKVWPAEVESRLYEHPDIHEACVVASADPYRGETVKAYIVLRPGRQSAVRGEDIIEWSKARMAAYKYPRLVEFVDALPKSHVGKILWRELQDRENQRKGEAPK